MYAALIFLSITGFFLLVAYILGISKYQANCLKKKKLLLMEK